MIEIENIGVKIENFSLKDISLNINRGEYFALMGPTGAGKSVLVKAICGLIRIDSGKIRIFGRDVTALEPGKRKIGYVPQHSGLFPHLNVRQNLEFAINLKGKHRKAQDTSGISQIIEALDLKPLLTRKVDGLSGGERQKVALGRALAAEPELLILDEPVSALDEVARRKVCEEIMNIHKSFNITTVHICHNLDEANTVASRIGIINDGRFVASGSFKELSADKENEILRKFFDRGN